jgi:hypothetical protein
MKTSTPRFERDGAFELRFGRRQVECLPPNDAERPVSVAEGIVERHCFECGALGQSQSLAP